MQNTETDRLVKQISAALEEDPNVNLHQWPISVWSEEGKVALDGRVEHIAAKRRATAVAELTLAGKIPLLDLLRVVPAETKEDLELRDEVVNMLSGEPVFTNYTLRAEVDGNIELIHDAGLDAAEIHANIHNGVVTLSGHVGSLSHLRLAEVLVWWTAGCEAVRNLLKVVPPEEDHDNEITDAVVMVLEKDPLVHATQLRVGTAGGIVTLLGSVASEEERKLAVRDAWYVPGVWDVVDRIEARS